MTYLITEEVVIGQAEYYPKVIRAEKSGTIYAALKLSHDFEKDKTDISTVHIYVEVE